MCGNHYEKSKSESALNLKVFQKFYFSSLCIALIKIPLLYYITKVV